MSAVEDLKIRIAEHYDRAAEELDHDGWYAKGGSVRVPESAAAHYFIDRKVSLALQLAEPGPVCRALEVGCSVGMMTPLLARDVEELTAIDLSPRSVRVAAERLSRFGVENVRFECLDMEKMAAFPESAFDRVFSFSTVRYASRPDRALAEIHRVLRDGGIAVVDFPNRHCLWHVFVKRFLGIEKHFGDRLYSGRELRRLFTRAGFAEVQIRYLLFTPRRLPEASLPVFRIIDQVFERIPLLRRLAGIIMVRAVRGA